VEDKMHLLETTEKPELPFALRQHVPAEKDAPLGDPKQPWVWAPEGGLKEGGLEGYVASGRYTRYNSGGVADAGEGM
jgi:hypothetical protein